MECNLRTGQGTINQINLCTGNPDRDGWTDLNEYICCSSSARAFEGTRVDVIFEDGPNNATGKNIINDVFRMELLFLFRLKFIFNNAEIDFFVLQKFEIIFWLVCGILENSYEEWKCSSGFRDSWLLHEWISCIKQRNSLQFIFESNVRWWKM